MSNKFIVFAFLLLQQSAKAQSGFVSPIAGVYGKDFILVNYVDWDSNTTFHDNHCSTKTYDGHQGTDFVVRSFRVQDSGLDVRTVDNGRVIFVKDGLFDREKISIVSKGFGNYIGISHAGKLQTYYGHLKKGSIIVKAGDSVWAGQKIAQVGSSGNSEGTHLHFELWYDSTYNIDPFSGPCGNVGSYWKVQPKFDTSFGLWTSGMTNYVCTLDTLKEEPARRDTFFAIDPAITYWNLQYGLRKNDSLRIEWYNPAGLLWWTYGYKSDKDYWYAFFWSHINTPSPGTEGKWNIKYFRNNVLTAARPFYYYSKPTGLYSLDKIEESNWELLYTQDRIVMSGSMLQVRYHLYDVQGRLIELIENNGREYFIDKNKLPKGLYLLERIDANFAPSRKKIMNW